MNFPLVQRLRQNWDHSLRFRLLALGLMPLLIAFPVVIAVLVIVGGEKADTLLFSNLRSSLAGSRNYLDQVRQDAAAQVDQLVKSERLAQLLHGRSNRRELDEALRTASRGSGLDFLVVALPDGTVIGSSSRLSPSARLPDTYVVRQARIGVANAAFERLDGGLLAGFSGELSARARVLAVAPEGSVVGESRALMINAAAHFPLAADDTDAILVGGILLNQNIALIEHMRQIIFPVGTLPGDAEGVTALHVDGTSIVISRQRGQGQRNLGTRAPAMVTDTVLAGGDPWLGRIDLEGEPHLAGYEPLLDGDGQRIGMVGVAIPSAPYQKAVTLILAMTAALLALTLLAISILFLGAGRDMTQRLQRIVATMARVSQGDRAARVGVPAREDELGQLTRHFDGLLDTIANQDEVRRAALKTIADEASRRRALFEHERDGVVILNEDGSVFEANPKCTAMLGYAPEALNRLRLADWDARHSPAELEKMLATVTAEGLFFETVHRRSDGSCYPAEVSVSRAQWGDKSFRLVLQRDISERKAVEAELAEHRQNLERLVDERTRELNNRSEQLNAIFALSPDGLLSFDGEHRISFANAAFLRLTGMSASQVEGLAEDDFSDLLAKKCVAGAVFPGVAALRSERLKSLAPEHADAHHPPRRQLIELTGPGNRILEVGIRLAEAENVSQILYFRDVTHETEVDRIKSEFLTTAAHELRTPMQSIYGYSELLAAQEFDAEFRDEMLESIHRNSSLMISITNELLDLARIEARQGKDFIVELLPLSGIVREAVADYKPPTGRDAPASDEIDAALQVRADRNKMRQVMLNILSNAYKYSPEGGSVRIGVRRAGEGVAIDVRDQGMGMTPGQLERVCERFYRADASGKILGAGLGMSIVKEIVELHGGRLEFESKVGAGTTVTVWLPLEASGA